MGRRSPPPVFFLPAGVPRTSHHVADPPRGCVAGLEQAPISSRWAVPATSSCWWSSFRCAVGCPAATWSVHPIPTMGRRGLKWPGRPSADGSGCVERVYEKRGCAIGHPLRDSGPPPHGRVVEDRRRDPEALGQVEVGAVRREWCADSVRVRRAAATRAFSTAPSPSRVKRSSIRRAKRSCMARSFSRRQVAFARRACPGPSPRSAGRDALTRYGHPISFRGRGSDRPLAL